MRAPTIDRWSWDRGVPRAIRRGDRSRRPTIDRWRIRPARERGDVALEMVLLAPIIIFMIFVVIQFALWYHARHVVTAAAQEGARVARAANTSAAAAEQAGRDRAYTFIDTLGGSIVEDPNVVVNRGVATVSVRVTGTAIHIVPGLRLQVRGQSVGPVERFVPPS
jgi:Flp pilus assembly protein TadG